MIEIIRNSILITGLVVIMMMMIESLNIESKGLFFKEVLLPFASIHTECSAAERL